MKFYRSDKCRRGIVIHLRPWALVSLQNSTKTDFWFACHHQIEESPSLAASASWLRFRLFLKKSSPLFFWCNRGCWASCHFFFEGLNIIVEFASTFFSNAVDGFSNLLHGSFIIYKLNFNSTKENYSVKEKFNSSPDCHLQRFVATSNFLNAQVETNYKNIMHLFQFITLTQDKLKRS